MIVSNLDLGAQQDTYKVSVLTCDRGNDLYTTFGHSALRLLNNETGRDLVFNYGTFDFRTDNFYPKFMRGQLPYYLSVAPTNLFLDVYTREERTIVEQVIDLDSTEVSNLLGFLETNTLPENREYAYDFFFDNCSTRLLDMLNTLSDEPIDYGPPKAEHLTYRNLLDEHLVYMPWSDFGIDLVIGGIADQEASVPAQMYIPSYLFYYLAQANTTGKPLVKSTNTLLDFKKEADLRNTYFFMTPTVCAWIILIIGTLLFFLSLYGNKPLGFKIFSISMSVIVSIIGVVIVFLWFFTNHGATGQNWNLLWLSPLYFLLIPSIIKRSDTAFSKIVRWILIAGNVICLVLWAVIPQQFHWAFIPLMISLLIILLSPWIIKKYSAKVIV